MRQSRWNSARVPRWRSLRHLRTCVNEALETLVNQGVSVSPKDSHFGVSIVQIERTLLNSVNRYAMERCQEYARALGWHILVWTTALDDTTGIRFEQLARLLSQDENQRAFVSISREIGSDLSCVVESCAKFWEPIYKGILKKSISPMVPKGNPI